MVKHRFRRLGGPPLWAGRHVSPKTPHGNHQTTVNTVMFYHKNLFHVRMDDVHTLVFKPQDMEAAEGDMHKALALAFLRGAAYTATRLGCKENRAFGIRMDYAYLSYMLGLGRRRRLCRQMKWACPIADAGPSGYPKELSMKCEALRAAGPGAGKVYISSGSVLVNVEWINEFGLRPALVLGAVKAADRMCDGRARQADVIRTLCGIMTKPTVTRWLGFLLEAGAIECKGRFFKTVHSSRVAAAANKITRDLNAFRDSLTLRDACVLSEARRQAMRGLKRGRMTRADYDSTTKVLELRKVLDGSSTKAVDFMAMHPDQYVHPEGDCIYFRRDYDLSTIIAAARDPEEREAVRKFARNAVAMEAIRCGVDPVDAFEDRHEMTEVTLYEADLLESMMADRYEMEAAADARRKLGRRARVSKVQATSEGTYYRVLAPTGRLRRGSRRYESFIGAANSRLASMGAVPGTDAWTEATLFSGESSLRFLDKVPDDIKRVYLPRRVA